MTVHELHPATDPSKLSTIEVTAFGQHCEYTGVYHDNNDPRSRERWLARRADFLTASDVAAVMGENKNKSALEVFLDKTTERGPKVEPGPDKPNAPMFWGNVLEQPILTNAARYYGWKYRAGGFLLASRSVPDLACTLDAEIDCNDGEGWIPNEGKTTQVTEDWDQEAETMPEWVLIQSQVQLLVTGASRNMVYALLNRSREVKIVVTPSVELHRIITEYTDWFMDHLRRRVPPPPDGSESSRTALARIYPRGDGSAVRLPEEALEWTREFQALSERITADTKRRDLMKNLIRSHIGHATHGILAEPVGGVECWRNKANKGTDVRSLITMKHAPERMPIAPSPGKSELEEILEESTLPEHAERARLTRKRRRAKR